MTFRIERLTPTAIMPRRATPGSAGLDAFLDLYLPNGALREIKTSTGKITPFTAHDEIPTIDMFPGQRLLLPLGIRAQIPENTYLRVAPRSGLAVKSGVDILAGVVDRDYRGEICAVVYCTSHKPIRRVPHGTRITQLILEKYDPSDPEEGPVEDATERGQGGFGSTGTA